MITAILVLTLLGLTLGLLLGLTAKFLAVPEGNPLVLEVEALLPGSQCGQCGFAGCKPAAQAIADGSAKINCCPPGGRALTDKLAALLGVDVATLGAAAAPVVAVIRNAQCTGCTRCAKSCPTDAIIGATRQLHSVLNRACSGCGKCVGACPENCIELTPEAVTLNNWHWPKPQGV
jgi:electron transport complex protein RnfB